MPALKLAVGGITPVLEVAQIRREVVDLLSGFAALLGYGNLDDWKDAEHIEFGQVQCSVVVDGRRVLEINDIEVSSSTLGAGGDTEPASDILQCLFNLIKVLGLEEILSDKRLWNDS